MALKRLPEDFKDFLNSLNKNDVKYLLLGGWAVGIYGHPRATGDMDVLIAVDEKNLDRLLKASKLKLKNVLELSMERGQASCAIRRVEGEKIVMKKNKLKIHRIYDIHIMRNFENGDADDTSK